ncbi:MAG TPA: patatin-like phospholipase family protein [Pyrinomonadaceae bacterium]|jgi:predicted acylesterase/phospholipase RssA/ABC-type phosphate/phosphonate transport system substrate-binding protein
MSRRFPPVAFALLALLAVSLLPGSDLFKSEARRLPPAQGTSQPSRSAAAPSASAATARRAAQPARREPLVVRIGVVNYNGTEQTHLEYQQVLTRMAQAEGASGVSFRLVDGAYDDVLEWYKSGLVNVAILSPGVIAELAGSDEWRGELESLYVASEGLKPAPAYDPFATAERHKPGVHYLYRSVCLVPRDSPVKSVEDIKRLAAEFKIKFLFVHPLSVSGRILPEYALRAFHRVDLKRTDVEWTYDHNQSLRELLEPDPDGAARVAFVKDDAEVSIREGATPAEVAKYSPDKFRKIDIPELDADIGLIPQDVVLIHPTFSEHKELIKRLFLGYSKLPASTDAPWRVYEERPEWRSQYARVVDWVGQLNLTANEHSDQFLRLEQIVGKLRNLKRNRPDTRLALVLSGGGAKCAYQLGAIRAIEDALDEHTDDEGNREVDIDLVVGTSGGAINALCVALGVTRDPRGMSDLERTWQGFSQATFFEPWRPFTATVGLFLGLLQSILVILGVRLFAPEKINWHRHVGVISSAMIALATLLALTRYRAGAIIPLLLLLLIVCTRLFSNPTREWWKHAGWALLALALVETPAAFFEWTPWRHTEYAAAAVLAAVQLVVIVVAVRVYDAHSRHWWRYSLAIFAAAAVVEFFLLRRTEFWQRLSKLGKDHVVHHLWMLLTMGSGWAVGSLLAVGGGLLLVGYKQFGGWRPMGYNIIPSARKLFIFRRILLTRLALALAAIVALQLSLTLFHNGSLSNSAGVQSAMAQSVPALVRRLHKDLSVSGATDEERLSDLSRQIVEGDRGGDWLTRDLVITSMRLPAGEGAPPGASPGASFGSAAAASGAPGACARADKGDAASDWYFYFDHEDAHQRADEAKEAAADAHAADRVSAESSDESIRRDARFRSLRCGEYRDKLMDVVIGSSSIFPVFQPRPLLARSGEGAPPAALAELIDGGFAHNSPIEAAVLWGATHIILVEASPEERQGARSDYLLANSISAFNYLFNQAQLVDAHSRGKVEIFSLRPQIVHRRADAGQTDASRKADAAENPCASSYALSEDGSAPVGANMCTFDFVQDFVKGAIYLGGSDASKQCFRRERAQPLF